VDTQDHLADIFIKPLAMETSEKLRDLVQG